MSTPHLTNLKLLKNNMQHKIYLIANWKMQLLDSEAVKLTEELKNQTTKEQGVEIILCPSFTALSKVGEILRDPSTRPANAGLAQDDIRPKIRLGAQNVFYHEKGSYTGEVSPAQLKELGVAYIILGHSERRQHLKESDEDVNRKVNICLANNMTPILCLGETFDERRTGQTDLILIKQVTRALQDVKLKAKQRMIIAYEPVWVIGSGQAIQPQDAQHAAQVIKHTLLDFFDEPTMTHKISIIYGGSVDEKNVKDFIKPGLLDGVLVGGASLSVEKFLPMIEQLKNN